MARNNTLDSSTYISHARLKIIRKSFLILSADPVYNINFLQCFPEKAYGSNLSFFCGFYNNTLSAKGRHFLNKPPLIPYLGKIYSVVLIGQLKNPSIVPNI